MTLLYRSLKRSRRLLGLFVLLCLVGCGEQTAPVDVPGKDAQVETLSEAQKLRAFFDASFDEDLARNPSTASYLGVNTRHGEWNDYSEAFAESERELAQTRLEQIQAFDRDALDEQSRLSLTLYELGLERDLMSDEFRHHRYVIHQHRGPHTQIPSFLINIHRVATQEDAEAYVERLRNVPVMLDGVIEQLNIRSDKGLFLVDWMYPKMVSAAGNVVKGKPFDDSGKDSPLWADFSAKVAALDIEQGEKDRLLAAAQQAMQEQMLPAYQRLIDVLNAQAPQASDKDGVWRLPQGDAYYQTLLKWYTTTDLTAEEVHQLGLDNVKRIHNEMRAVQEALDFDGTLQQFFAFMRANPDVRYPNDDTGRDAYLADARKAIDAMREQLPAYFGVLPQAPMIVKRVEEFREQTAGKAFYQSPPPDGSRPGIYYANLYDMNAMPKTDLEALAFHEGLPGHHLQRAIAAELEGIPEFQRYLSFTAYSEGWGLYSEYLAKEMGFYTDPYSEFGRLSMELWRAARLVVDTGLHSKRWSREEAIAYLVENTPNAESDCTKAIERYIAMPGQATAYMIGKIKILSLREQAKEALGDKFDIRAFHDAVLGKGPIPLDVLEANVMAMIEQG